MLTAIDASLDALALPPPYAQDVSPATWPGIRAELIRSLSDHVYGITPEVDWTVRTETVEGPTPVLDGLGTRSQLVLTVRDARQARSIDVLLFLPLASPAPVITALNTDGNHTIMADPAIRLPAGWVPDRKPVPTSAHRAIEQGRGAMAHSWPVRAILTAGFGLAAVYAGDIEPDNPDLTRDGVRGLDHDPGPRRWGTLGTWAWGLSRVREQLAARDDVRDDAIVVAGHSRMGKTALWAAAQDDRFAAAVSNASGCGGAALSRRSIGESLASITSMFPHWFTPGFARFAGREDELPIDQHHLLAAIAPRPVYVDSGVEDEWCDPVGEFLAVAAAARFHGRLGSPRIGYHLRPGPHALTGADWAHILTFLDDHAR